MQHLKYVAGLQASVCLISDDRRAYGIWNAVVHQVRLLLGQGNNRLLEFGATSGAQVCRPAILISPKKPISRTRGKRRRSRFCRAVYAAFCLLALFILETDF